MARVLRSLITVLIVGVLAVTSATCFRDSSHVSRSYAATISYVLQHRSYAFPGKAAYACLMPGDWPARKIAQSLRGYHLPVDAECPAGRPVDGIQLAPLSIERMSLIEGANESDDVVVARIVYSDGRARAAYTCLLEQRRDRWELNGCDVDSVSWSGAPAPAVSEAAGCWAFSWTPIHTASDSVLPRAAVLNLARDTTVREFVLDGRVMAPSGTWRTAQWEQWGLGWRWDSVGPGVLELRGGGVFEGRTARLVLEPNVSVMRGYAYHWDDAPSEWGGLTDPDWRVYGTRDECRVPVRLPN